MPSITLREAKQGAVEEQGAKRCDTKQRDAKQDPGRPAEPGAATIAITLEDPAGDVLLGRIMLEPAIAAALARALGLVGSPNRAAKPARRPKSPNSASAAAKPSEPRVKRPRKDRGKPASKGWLASVLAAGLG